MSQKKRFVGTVIKEDVTENSCVRAVMKGHVTFCKDCYERGRHGKVLCKGCYERGCHKQTKKRSVRTVMKEDVTKKCFVRTVMKRDVTKKSVL